jgi:hypothetical protein
MNLLKHGDFEDDEEGDSDDDWMRTGSAVYSYEARFSGKQGIYFDGTPAGVSQLVEGLPAGLYTLHFFLAGKCGVKIRNDEGKYWNGTAKPDNYILAWQDEEYVNEFSSAEWNDVFCIIRLDSLITGLSVEFVPLAGVTAGFDYVRLFEKPANPSYTITFQFEGYALSSKTLHLGAGGEDPVIGINYKKESYFDHSFIVGRQGAYRSEVYKSVLDTVRPRGIQAFAEFVEKTDLGGEAGA